MNKDYVKIVSDGIAYYIRKEHVTHIDWKYDGNLMALSYFVVDIATNKVLKCRLSMETLIDSYTGV